jgi:hypothetical protein
VGPQSQSFGDHVRRYVRMRDEKIKTVPLHRQPTNRNTSACANTTASPSVLAARGTRRSRLAGPHHCGPIFVDAVCRPHRGTGESCILAFPLNSARCFLGLVVPYLCPCGRSASRNP